jgi:hypothetical protein
MIALGNCGGRERSAAAIRPEQEFDVVFVDQLLDELHRRIRIALVVVILDSNLVFLAADIDAAHVIDVLDVKVIAVLHPLSFRRELAGERERGTELDDICILGGGDHCRRSEQADSEAERRD